jgi:hypothetical protein
LWTAVGDADSARRDTGINAPSCSRGGRSLVKAPKVLHDSDVSPDSPDISSVVTSIFGDRSPEALSVLAAYAGDQPDTSRVILAVLKLSGDDMDRLRHFVDVANKDSRDVLYWAEYPRDPSEPKSYSELRERLNLRPEPEH